MTKLERAAMKQALDALEEMFHSNSTKVAVEKYNTAHNALREALAEQAEHDRNYGELADTNNWTPPNYTDEQWQKLDQEYQDHVAEQEPVATLGMIHPDWFKEVCEKCNGNSNTPLYAAPVRTKDLTDDEMEELCRKYARFELIREAIAADREKNK